MTPKNIEGPHCQSCGSTDPETISNLDDTEGYTRCCNELVIYVEQPTRFNFRTGRHEPFGEPACDPDLCYHD